MDIINTVHIINLVYFNAQWRLTEFSEFLQTLRMMQTQLPYLAPFFFLQKEELVQRKRVLPVTVITNNVHVR